ncbi:hypothetical protein ES288_A08G086800v1 [Gossypium darwinii]|uniref:Uncharacterized protein n=1 Tax=Gossypium darwinii TaxID=34276 RepID=A0A5D2FJH6_GOSDA|nr:hypothetical protein ES288_A08G086800v1 [Gossypium darwinii]
MVPVIEYQIFRPRSLMTTVVAISLKRNCSILSEKLIAGIPSTVVLTTSSSRNSKSSSLLGTRAPHPKTLSLHEISSAGIESTTISFSTIESKPLKRTFLVFRSPINFSSSPFSTSNFFFFSNIFITI